MYLISIKKRSDFLFLSKSNICFHSKTSLVLSGKTPEKYLTNPHTRQIDHFCRFGLTVSKKVGNAVVRNKIKRQYRQALILLNKEQSLESYFDYSIIAKRGIVNGSFQNICDDLKFCFKHIKRLIKEDELKQKQ